MTNYLKLNCKLTNLLLTNKKNQMKDGIIDQTTYVQITASGPLKAIN